MLSQWKKIISEIPKTAEMRAFELITWQNRTFQTRRQSALHGILL